MQDNGSEPRNTVVVAFPERKAHPHGVRRVGPDKATLQVLRRCARRSHVAGRLDLETLCAKGEADQEIWGAALLQASARGSRNVVLHRGGAASASECWLAQLLNALTVGDEVSARFILERHVRPGERRLAMFFAQKLAHGRATAREDGRRSA